MGEPSFVGFCHTLPTGSVSKGPIETVGNQPEMRLEASRQALPTRVISYPARIRTWKNRTKTCCDTVSPPGSAVLKLNRADAREDNPCNPALSHRLPVPWVEPEDVAKAVICLPSSRACFITGSQFVLDAGFSAAEPKGGTQPQPA